GGPGDGGGARAAVGQDDVAIDGNGMLPQRLEVDRGPERTADEPLDLEGPAADAPAFPGRPGRCRAGEHGVFGRDPPGAGLAPPVRYAFLDRGHAEDPGASHRDHARPLRELHHVRLDDGGPEFVGRASGANRDVHCVPPRMRSMREVVERPWTNGSTRTSPPAASTSARPTMPSRV